MNADAAARPVLAFSWTVDRERGTYVWTIGVRDMYGRTNGRYVTDQATLWARRVFARCPLTRT